MSDRNWLVTDDGRCIPLDIAPSPPTRPDEPYRLYRFLTDVEDIIGQESDDRLRLQKICPLVRRLLNSSEWILTSFSFPEPDADWSVESLYDEPDFPLTVQTVVWSPQQRSSVHNHATWGIVALLDESAIDFGTDRQLQNCPIGSNQPDRISSTQAISFA